MLLNGERVVKAVCFDTSPKCVTDYNIYGYRVKCSDIGPNDDLTALIEEQVEVF